MSEKKVEKHPNIEVMPHHKTTPHTFAEFKYFVQKYYLYILLIAIIPVMLYSLGVQLANSGSAAPSLMNLKKVNVGTQTACTDSSAQNNCKEGENTCWFNSSGQNNGSYCECKAGIVECDGGNKTVWKWSCYEDKNKCPVGSPTPKLTPGQECPPGKQVLQSCGNAQDLSEATCNVCDTNGRWSYNYNRNQKCNITDEVRIACRRLSPSPAGGNGQPPPGGGGNANEQCQPGSWEAPKNCGKRGCSLNESARCKDDGSGWYCVGNPALCG